MKIVFLLAALFFLKAVSYSQWPGNQDPLTIKELKLTRLQEKKIRQINSDLRARITLLQKNGSSGAKSVRDINKIRAAGIKKINTCLNQEQQLTWRKILRANKPRRGVTGLPNERTVQ